MNASEVRRELEERGVRRVKVGGFDIDGVLRGKYLSLDKFYSAIESDIGFCDVIFGWDIADVLYDNAKVTGWATGYPDAKAKIDLSTLRMIPWEPGTAAFLLDFATGDGEPHPACPRSLFKRVLARANAMGFKATFAAEFEFFIFKETPESMRAKGYRNLTPLSPGMFGYSWLRSGQHQDLSHAILDEMEAFDISIEGFHTETGPGVYEIALRYDDALRMADKAALFKTALKQLLHRMGLSVTFMAKWNHDLPGSSGHIHQSLWSKTEKSNLFYDESGPHNLSPLALSYLAGQLELMPELTALYAPTINSYKRYVPGVWAPLNATWGIENRTASIRAIPGSMSSTRLEYRQTAADMNPYIAMATVLAAGLYGIEHARSAPPPSSGDASVSREAIAPLPRTLKDATQLLAQSTAARELLGETFVDHYVRTREWEVRQHERVVTDWELARYFESI